MMKQFPRLPLYRTLCLLVSLAGWTVSFAQWRITGKVSDGSTGEPLVGASVSVAALGKGVYSDGKGAYDLNLPAAKPPFEVQVKYNGYSTAVFTINPGDPNPTNRDITLSPEGFTTEDVVITATKGFQQAQSDVTVSIEVMKPRFLDLQALPSVDKALSQIPGVDNQDGQINIRGSSGYAYGVGSRVMLTLDGLPLLTADAGTASLDMIPVDNINQIEVMKGASSVLYGSSALGGVINVITSDPGDKPRTAIRIRGGVFGLPANPAIDWDGAKSPWSGSVHLFHSRRIGKKVDFTFQSNTIKESGYRQGTDTEQYRNMFMLRYRPVNGLTLGLNASLSVDSSGQILYWRGYYPDTTEVNGQEVVSGGALTPTLDGGGYRRQLTYELALDPQVKYLSKSGHLFWYRGRYLAGGNRNNTNQESNSFIFYNDFLYQKTLFKKVNFVVGATYTRSGIQGDSLYGGTYVINGDTLVSDGSHTGDSFGAYSQLDAKFGRINASLGVRYETVRISTAAREAQPIFRAGLNYKIAEGTNVRASFGQAFRVPSVAERFANTSGGGILVEPNPSIQSERGYSAEFALRQGFRSEGAKWGIKGYLDLAAFMMQFDNMVEFGIKTRRIAFPQLDIRFSSINVADARILGSELTGMLIAESKDKKTFATFSGGVTWIEPTDLNAVPDSLQLDLVQFPSDIVNQAKTDQPPFLKYRSRWTIRGSASVGYHGLSLTANYRYKSFVQNIDQYLFLVIDDLADFRSRYPNGDHVMDFIAAWEFNRRQTVSLTLDNAFNREYLIIPGLLAPQRKFTLQYQLRF